MARGQLSYQTVIMILAAFVIVIVILMGRQFVTSFVRFGIESQFIVFEKALREDARAMSARHGSVRSPTYQLPEYAQKACLMDLSRSQEIVESISINDEPVMKDALLSGAETNVFVFSDSIERSFSVPEIEVPLYPYFVCVRNLNGVTLGLKGHGGKALVLTDLVSKAKLVPGAAADLYSTDGLVKMEIPAQQSPSAEQVTIEIMPPTDAGQASETYKLGPSGTTFDPPARLTLEYIPELVGDCPAALTFTYHYDLTGEERDFDAVSINCHAHLATFVIDRI